MGAKTLRSVSHRSFHCKLQSITKGSRIGNKSALRIVQARKNSTLDFSILKRLGLVLKRAQYFITCHGKMLYSMPIEENFITRQLTAEQKETSWKLEHPQTYQQLSLFDDHFLDVPPTIEDNAKVFWDNFKK